MRATTSDVPTPLYGGRLTRRDLLGFAAHGGAAIVVPQTLLGCTEPLLGTEPIDAADPQTGGGASTRPHEFTPQFLFEESLADAAHVQAPYGRRGRRKVVDGSDGFYNGLSASEKVSLTQQAASDGDGYAGAIPLAVRIG